MNCPKCNADTKVIDRRGERRRRECVECKHRFSTVELLAERGRTLKVKDMPEQIQVAKPAKPAVVKPKVSKPNPNVTTLGLVKRNADARRKIEELRESFMDPDYDYLPERW